MWRTTMSSAWKLQVMQTQRPCPDKTRSNNTSAESDSAISCSSVIGASSGGQNVLVARRPSSGVERKLPCRKQVTAERKRKRNDRRRLKSHLAGRDRLWSPNRQQSRPCDGAR